MHRALLSLLLFVVPAATRATEYVEVAPPSWGTEGYADIVDQVLPAVVSLSVIKVSAAQSNQGNMTARRQRFFGSGFVIDPKGIIVTNRHVIQGAVEITAVFADNSHTEARLVGVSNIADIAVLTVNVGHPLPALEFANSGRARIGNEVMAIGNPYGLGISVSAGIVSGLNRDLSQSPFDEDIQTDAVINPGNSGGALVDLDGKLVGINSAIYSRSGGSMGIGFAIPVNMVKSVIAAARQGGATVRRPWLGATLQSLTKDIADNLGIDRPTGALVVTVAGDGPSFDAGLKRGDVITAVDGQSVEDAESVGFRLGVKPLGGAATLSVLRNGRTLSLPLKLAAAPENPPRDALTIRSRSPFQGAEVMNMSPAVAEELSLEGVAEGVVVASVGDGSTAADVGVQKGDVVVAVNGQKIGTTRDLEKACAERARLWDLTIKRGAQTIRTQLGG